MKAWIQPIENLSARVKRFRVRLDKPIIAVPGQFVTLSFPTLKNEQGDCIERSYSLLSWGANDKGPYIDLAISLNDNGIATPWLWQLTDEVLIESSEALGNFTLKDYCLEEFSFVERVVFISTGTGVVPFVPMIHQLLAQHASLEIVLCSGHRYLKDELFASQFTELTQQYNSFKYLPVFSREPKLANSGYVHAHYSKFITPNTHAYVCGWSEMCKETRNTLKGLGLTRKQYFFELYN